MVFDLQAERKELADKVSKLEAGKDRMEKILKQTLGKKGSMDPTDLIDEIGILMKRIEYLE